MVCGDAVLVWTTADVGKGEEIAIDRTDDQWELVFRFRRFREWNYRCECRYCAHVFRPMDVQRSQAIYKLANAIGDGLYMQMISPAKAYGMAIELVREIRAIGKMEEVLIMVVWGE